MMCVETFNPIDDWLTKWKERNVILYRKLHGEKQDTDFDAAVNWMTTISPQLLKDYDPSQIFDTNETRLFYWALPDHTHMFKTESSKGYKKIKQQLTVLLSCNMMGTIKKRSLVTGGSKGPRCFKALCQRDLIFFPLHVILWEFCRFEF